MQMELSLHMNLKQIKLSYKSKRIVSMQDCVTFFLLEQYIRIYLHAKCPNHFILVFQVMSEM